MPDVLLALFNPSVRARWEALGVADRVARLQQERLLPIALAHAHSAGCLDSLQAGLWEIVVQRGRLTAEIDDQLLERVLPAMHARGCRPLLLKGAALGRWLYAAPELRLGSDIDLLVDPRRRLDAHAVLTAVGLCSDGYSHHNLASNQATYVDKETGRHIDLHWALSTVPELACRFDFEQLDSAAISLERPSSARVFGRIDALMHSVVHYCAHEAVDDRPLIWLYDLTLLARGFDASSWAELDSRVRNARLAGLHAAAFQLAAATFPLELPGALMQQWRALGTAECTSGLLQTNSIPALRLLRSISCMTSLRGRIGYLRARLVPSAAWMQGRYGTTNRYQLFKAYLHRWSDGLMQAVLLRR